MEIMTADAYNTMTLRRLLRQNGAMSRQDRAFVTEVVNGTLRNLIYIDHVLNTFSKTKTEKMKPWLLAVLRTAVYQMYFMDVPDAAACNEAVKLASVRGYGSLKGFVNGVLRTAAKKKQEITRGVLLPGILSNIGLAETPGEISNKSGPNRLFTEINLPVDVLETGHCVLYWR